MKRRRNSVTVSVDVDIDELVEELTDEEIIDLAERVGHSGPRGEVQRAIIMLRQGRVDDGIALLEREFFPTWKSKAACETAYQLAMGRVSA
ncbi:hypothetical protein [Shinella sp.]|uniref:hypothetical protein n=1 Tax=Shinella sp. TaxID=1870904 RepID=UPI0028A82266|nr:hypothetical protein [Shinella sp.]